jgi:hypothetical protein
VFVRDDLIYVDIGSDTIDVILGNSVSVSAGTYWPEVGTEIEWKTDTGGSISCASCPNILLTPVRTGNTYIYIMSEDGCMSSDSVFIRVIKDRRLFAPNIFSPSSNSGNANFSLLYLSPSMQIDWLHIYDRWGSLVFVHTGNLSGEMVSWNGTIKGRPAEEGVYVWVAGISYLDGENEIRSGNVTIVR